MPAVGTKFLFKGVDSHFNAYDLHGEVAAVDFVEQFVKMKSGDAVSFEAWEWMMENCRSQFVFINGA